MGICYCIWLYRRFLLQWQGSGKRYEKGRITGSLKRFGGVDRNGIISGSYKRQKEILKRHCSTAALHDCTGGGIEKSLKAIQELFKNGHETKDDYANAFYEHIKHIRTRSRVIRETKLLHSAMIVITSCLHLSSVQQKSREWGNTAY